MKFTSALNAFKESYDKISPNESRRYKIVNAKSEMSLNVSGGSYADSANIEQYEYDEWNSQKWQFVEVESGYYKIVNKKFWAGT